MSPPFESLSHPSLALLLVQDNISVSHAGNLQRTTCILVKSLRLDLQSMFTLSHECELRDRAHKGRKVIVK